MLAPLLLLLGCGEDSAEPGSGRDDWPVGSPVDTVLAYAAGTPDALQLGAFFETQLGWRPEGLASERQAVVAILDGSVMGGPLGLALPVVDPAALRDSLASCPGVEFSDEKRFSYTLPTDSQLINAMRAVRGMMNSGSLTEMMAAIGQPVPTTSTWELTFREGQALIVPSFEAAFVVGKLLEHLPLDSAASQAEGLAPGVVLSFDLERIRLTFYEEYQSSRRQLEAVLSGDPEAGAAGALGRMLSERGGDVSPVDGPMILALLEMVAFDSVGAIQLQAQGLPPVAELFGGVAGDESSDESGGESGLGLADRELQLTFRQRWSEPSALSELLGSLRPVPEQEQAGQQAMLSADPDTFPQALAAWLRPLVDVVHGPGEASDARLDDLVELVSPWGGLLMVGENDGVPLGVATLQPGERLDTSRLEAWFRPLLTAVEGENSRADQGDDGDDAGESALDEDDGLSLSTWSLDDLLVIGTGDEDPMAVEELLDSARSLRTLDTPAAGPWLELLLDAGQLTVATVGDSVEIVLGTSHDDAIQESR